MIYHIIDRDLWSEVEDQGYFRTESLEEEGFIHFSTKDQVQKVAEFQDREPEETVVLEVDEDRLGADLRFEGEDEKFPHLYGPLNLDAVVSVQGLDGFLN